MTLDDLARAVGVSTAQVSRWETKDVTIPRVRLTALAAALDCSVADILELDSGAQAGTSGISADETYRMRFREEAISQIPIFRCRIGQRIKLDGESIEQLASNRSAEDLQYISRPETLAKRRDIYALEYRGQSMEPTIRDGETILLENFGVKAGENVGVYLTSSSDNQDHNDLLIKRLLSQDADYVVLQQLNPEKTFRVPTSQILSIERVLRLEDTLRLVVG